MALQQEQRPRENPFSLFDEFETDRPVDLSQSRYVMSTECCPECGQAIVVISGVEECIECGIILGNSIDMGAEWRNDMEGGEDKNRCGLPVNSMFPESSYNGVGMSYRSKGFKKIFYGIQKTLQWTNVPHNEASLKERFENIASKCRDAGISDALIEYTQYIFYQVWQKLESRPDLKRVRGDNNEGLQGAALFKALQDDDHPKNYKELAAIFGVDSRHVSDGIKLIRELKAVDIKSNKYSVYIDGLCDRLHLDQSIKTRVAEVADKARKLGIIDNNKPIAIVAGCIYYVIVEAGIPSIGKKTINSHCKISVPTITNVCDKLCQRALELT